MKPQPIKSFPECPYLENTVLTIQDTNIKIRVLDVYSEPLNWITDAEAVQEGVEICNPYTGLSGDGTPIESEHIDKSPVDYFQELWNSIYNNWDDNPWVWVITFKLEEK
jgi:hypothetical protein